MGIQEANTQLDPRCLTRGDQEGGGGGEEEEGDRGIQFVVLETIRTGAMRVVHIPVKTEETQRLRIKFVLYQTS